MKKHTVCIFGGSGFIGSHLVAALSAQGHTVRVPSRRPHRMQHLLCLPGVRVVEARIAELASDPTALQTVLQGCDRVINLVGILDESRSQRYQDVHVGWPAALVAACAAVGVVHIGHMSALKAGEGHPYLASKAEGEQAVVDGCAKHGLHYSIFRPSIVFGRQDHFFFMLADLMRHIPLVLPVVAADFRAMPVYVGDVVHSLGQAVKDKHVWNQSFDLCGPQVMTMEEAARFTMRMLRIRRPVWHVGPATAALLSRLPASPVSRSRLSLLQIDSVAKAPFPSVFDCMPRRVDSIMPALLQADTMRGHYDGFRQQAGR